MRMKKAFTMSEILVAIGVVGILYLVLTPVVKNIKPTNEKTMVKKAYNTISRTVSEMINDDSIYPDYVAGFTDTTTAKPPNSYNKFCYYFIKNINTVSNDYSTCTAKTSDGITWRIRVESPKPDFIDNYQATITVTLTSGKSFDTYVETDGKVSVHDSDIIDILSNPMEVK